MARRRAACCGARGLGERVGRPLGTAGAQRWHHGHRDAVCEDRADAASMPLNSPFDQVSFHICSQV